MIKCSLNDLLCFEIKNKQDSRNAFMNSDSYMRIMDWLSDYLDDDTMNGDVDNEIEYDVLMVDDNVSKETEYDFSVKSHTSKVKRALELAEEYPPEATARPPNNDDESLTTRSLSSTPTMPSIPSMPSLPKPPTIPTLDPKNTLDMTTEPNSEPLETTTEDYGNIGEPNCDYDPFTFILKCGINLITSIFGLSDSCCKPLF